MRVTPDYLRIVTAPLQDDRVGMVTCSYLARRPKFIGSALASLARCCDFMPSLLIARAIDGGVMVQVVALNACDRWKLESQNLSCLVLTGASATPLSNMLLPLIGR